MYNDWATFEEANVVQQAYNNAFSNMSSIPQCNAIWTAVTSQTVPCLGADRGGESPEGTLYGNSTRALRQAENAIVFSGYNDPHLYGPQMSFPTSSYWDLRYLSDLSLQLGLSGVSSQPSRWAFLTDGDTNTNYTYPDNYEVDSAQLLFDYAEGQTSIPRYNGNAWLWMNSAFGLINGTAGSCSGGDCGILANLGTTIGARSAINFGIGWPAGNPTTTPPTDPRPSLPTDWFDAGNNHVILRDGGWTTGSNTIFDFYCTNTGIDHEHEYCGGFSLYSNGEFITKGRTEYNDYNDGMSIARFKNLPALLQYPTGTCEPVPSYCTYWQNAVYGGNWWHGYQQGYVGAANGLIYHSELPAYAAQVVNYVNAANSAGGGVYNDFNLANVSSRSMIYLRSAKQVFIYDRTGTTGSWDKSDYMITTGNPTISGNTSTWLTQSGNQKAVYTTLEPSQTTTKEGLGVSVNLTGPYTNLQNGTTMQATCTQVNIDSTTYNCTSDPLVIWYITNGTGSATISSTGLITATGTGTITVGCVYLGIGVTGAVTVISGSSSTPTLSASGSSDQMADWEPDYNIATDAGSTTAANFSALLQVGSSSFTPVTPSRVQSSSGQAFDGILAGTTLVMFSTTYPLTFTGMTYPASGATTQYVSNLAPNTSYPITGAGTPSSATSDNAGVLTFAATGTGNITVGAGSSVGAPTQLQGVVLSGVTVQ